MKRFSAARRAIRVIGFGSLAWTLAGWTTAAAAPNAPVEPALASFFSSTLWQTFWFRLAVGTILTATVGGSVWWISQARYRRRLEQIEQEQALGEVRQRFALVLENTSDAVGFATPDRRMSYLNPAGRRLLGFAPDEELTNYPTADGYPEWAYRLVTETALPTALREGIWRGETALRHRDGREIPVSQVILVHRDQAGAVQFVSSIARDMTEARRGEEALRESEERYRAVIDGLAEGIVIEDESGVIRSCNPSAMRILGLTAGQILGRATTDGSWQTVHEDGSPFLAADYPIVTTLRTGLPRTDVIMGVSRPDGTLAWISINSRALCRPGEKKPYASVASFHDITARKLAEERLRRLNEELEARVSHRTAELTAANKELESFSYSVSHDLRAPLRHISGFCGLLQENPAIKADPDTVRQADIITQAANKMGQLIDDLLVFSRMGRAALKAGPVNLAALVGDVRRELQPETAGRDILWQTGPLPIAHGDAAMLRLVFMNLLGNALKYTRPRTRAVIEIGSRGTGEGIEVFVRDNGVGFDMNYAGKLFGVFQRLHREEDFEGTGIGLANVRRIIHRHGGQTWAEGAPDRGATIYFTLPRSGAGG